jgi:hypothetical protein
MTKKLNTGSITNELENSSFFPSTARSVQGDQSSVTSEVAPAAPVAAGPEVSTRTPRPGPDTQPKKGAREALSHRAITNQATRGYVRRTFDIFEDQLQYLTRASLEDRLAGGEGSMNSMVREALDTFIEKQKAGNK